MAGMCENMCENGGASARPFTRMAMCRNTCNNGGPDAIIAGQGMHHESRHLPPMVMLVMMVTMVAKWVSPSDNSRSVWQ